MNGIIMGALSGAGNALQNIGANAQKTIDQQDLLKDQANLETQKAMALAQYQQTMKLNAASTERERVKASLATGAKPQDILANTGDLETAKTMADIDKNERDKVNTSAAYNDGIALGYKGKELENYVTSRGRDGSATPFKQSVAGVVDGKPALLVFDARTGAYTPANIGGQPVAPAAYDSNIKSNMATAGTTGEGVGKNYVVLQDAGVDATKKINSLNRLQGLLDGVNTGKLAPAGNEISAWAKAFGLPVGEGVGNAQALKAVANGLALELRNPSGGAGMPGAMSDADRNYLQGMVAGIDKDPQANAKILDGMQKLAERDQQVAKMARDYKKQHGQFDEFFYDQLADWSNAHPLFPNSHTAQPASQNAAPDYSHLWNK